MTGFLDYLSQEYQKGKRDLQRQHRIGRQIISGEDVTPEAPEPSEEVPLLSKKGVARMIGRGGVNMLPSLAGTLGGAGVGSLAGPIGSAIGAATGGGSVSASQSYIDAYNEALLSGKSKEEAKAYAQKVAGISGISDAALSALPFAGKPAASLVKGIAKQSAIQGLGAGGEQAARNVLAKSEGVDPERHPLENVGEAGVVGAGMKGIPLAAAGMVSKGLKQDVGRIPKATPETAQKFTADLNQEVIAKAKQLALAPPEAETSWFKPLSIQEIKRQSDVLQDKIFDDFTGIRKILPVREAENKAYRMARFSRHFDGIFESCLNEGTPSWNPKEGIIEMKPGSQGLLKILDPVLESAEKKSDFELYAYARRVKTQGLLEKGKEFNLNQEMVDHALRLEERHPVLQETFNKVQAYKKDVLDIAEQTGLIDPEKRKIWEQDDHIPFYRDMALPEDALIKTGLREPSKRLAGQNQVIHQLTGGKKQYAIFDDEGSYVGRQMAPSQKPGYTSELVGDAVKDITGNLMKNTSDLLQRSLRNAAARQTVDQAAEGGFARPVTRAEAMQRDKLKSNVVKVKEGGKDAYYQIEDELLYSALNASGSNQKEFGALHNVAKRWSKIYSSSIVMLPKTMVRIAAKDFIQSRILGRDAAIPFRESIQNVKAAYQHVFTKNKDPRIQAMMAMGAGDSFNQVSHEKVLKSIQQDLKDHNAMIPYGKALGTAWEKYKDIGKAGELASRLNRFDAAKKAGLSQAEAGFEALDYMDYKMRGSSDMVQLLSQITPFMSTHLASIHKLGREITGTKVYKNRTLRSAAALGSIAAVNTMINLSDQDESDANDYRALPDYIKISNMCVDLHKWIGKEAVESYNLPRHLLIPKPWEVGQLAMGVPEQFVRTLMGDETMRGNLDYIAKNVRGTFSIDPALGHPLVKTSLEQWAGKETFSDRPIVPRRYEDMPQEVKTPYQLDHLFTGLLGPLYSLPLMLFGDKGLGEAFKKAVDVRDVFRMNAPLERTKYENEFYDLYKEANEAKKYMDAVRRGEMPLSQDVDIKKTFLLKSLKKSIREPLKKLDEGLKMKKEQGQDQDVDRLRASKNQLLLQAHKLMGRK